MKIMEVKNRNKHYLYTFHFPVCNFSGRTTLYPWPAQKVKPNILIQEHALIQRTPNKQIKF